LSYVGEFGNFFGVLINKFSVFALEIPLTTLPAAAHDSFDQGKEIAQ